MKKMPVYVTKQSSQKVRYARALRQRMTETEEKLWQELRNRKLGCKFRRQVPLGLFIADFCCLEHQLILELDGKIHDEQEERDALRTKHLQNSNFRIIRFRNDKIKNHLPGVLHMIKEACKTPSSSQSEQAGS